MMQNKAGIQLKHSCPRIGLLLTGAATPYLLAVYEAIEIMMGYSN
jgi:hypothetical protein